MTEDDERLLNEVAPTTAGRGHITMIFTRGDVRRLFRRFMERMDDMAAELDNLRAEVARNADVTQSAVALIQGLKTKLDEAIASGDMSQVQALSDQLGQQDVALASAVQQNTPPAPAPQAGPRSPATGQQPDNDQGQVQSGTGQSSGSGR